MKSYEERLPLIDAAIDELNGEWPVWAKFSFCDRFMDKNNCSFTRERSGDVIFTRAEFEARCDERRNKPSWGDAPEWAQWLAQNKSGNWYWFSEKPICEEPIFYTRWKFGKYTSAGQVIGNWQDTLERRPETAEKPMKYEYGVEYPVIDRQKPDLPDDVEVDIRGPYYHGDWLNDPRPVNCNNWRFAKAFRIVDERYKPKSTWHERGELPPVGEFVAYSLPTGGEAIDYIQDNWNDGDRLKVISHEVGETCSVAVVWNERDKFAIGLVARCLRPLRTERDRLIDEARSLNYSCDVFHEPTARTMIANGWRPSGEQEDD